MLSMSIFRCPIGPSTQTTIGADKVVFNNIPVIFTPDGPKRKSVSAPIIDDNVALEDNETVTVNLTIVSPTAGVKLGLHKSTKVIIVDNDGKLATGEYNGVSCLNFIMKCIGPACPDVLINFYNMLWLSKIPYIYTDALLGQFYTTACDPYMLQCQIVVHLKLLTFACLFPYICYIYRWTCHGWFQARTLLLR